MLKILYILPALAMLGMLPAAEAATDQELQERIDRLQAKIDRLQDRIDAADPDRDANRIDKWEAKMAKHEGRIAELQAKMEGQPASTARLTETPEEQEPRALKQTSGDKEPPTVLSATLDGTMLTIVFDETVDFDLITLTRIFFADGVSSTSLQGATVANPSTDADTLSLTLSEALSDAIRDASDLFLDFASRSVADVSGNGIAAVSVPVVVTGSAPPDTTPPAVLSATQTGSTLTVVFDEEVTVVHDYGLSIGSVYVTGSSVSADSHTVTATIGEAALHMIDNTCVDQFQILPDAIKDSSGNFVSGTFDFARETTCTPTNPVDDPPVEEPPADTTPPTVLSATFDVTADTMTIVFDEAIDFSEVYLEEIWLGRYTLAGTTFDAAAQDSDTLVLAAHWSTAGNVLGLEDPELAFGRGSVRDVAGNRLQAVTVPITLANVPVPDATVTITAAGTFVEDAGTIEVPLGDDMTLEVRFVNEHGSDHTVLADLISWHFGHQSEDIPIQSGQSATVTFTVQEDAPRIGTDSERANIYLVFGVANIEETPEHEPDTIGGDHAIKVRITEPAS